MYLKAVLKSFLLDYRNIINVEFWNSGYKYPHFLELLPI